MKKGIYVPLSCAILTVAALSGCSTTNKIPDATIENAIQDSTNIYSDYGLSIQQLSFDSRNYDKQEKTEAVTVTVNADNADTSYTATYDVLGKLSDKSWRIVSVTQTSEEIKPKKRAVLRRCVPAIRQSHKGCPRQCTFHRSLYYAHSRLHH